MCISQQAPSCPGKQAHKCKGSAGLPNTHSPQDATDHGEVWLPTLQRSCQQVAALRTKGKGQLLLFLQQPDLSSETGEICVWQTHLRPVPRPARQVGSPALLTAGTSTSRPSRALRANPAAPGSPAHLGITDTSLLKLWLYLSGEPVTLRDEAP